MRQSSSHTASSAVRNTGQNLSTASSEVAKGTNLPKTLALRNLCIANGDRILLEGVGFEIVAGETTALMGTSGSGKSLSSLALQGIIARNLRCLSGEVLLDGRVLDEREIVEGRGKIYSSILQNPRTCFNPLLSLKSHIKESLDALGKEYVQDEVERILGEVGLESSALAHYPHELSGGMLQRAMIAISLLSGARFIIADEATTDLDMVVEYRILELLKRLQKERGLGILLISHDRRVVEFMAGRAYMIDRGKMCEYDLGGGLSAGSHLGERNLSLGNSFGKSHCPTSLDEREMFYLRSQSNEISQSNTANTSIGNVEAHNMGYFANGQYDKESENSDRENNDGKKSNDKNNNGENSEGENNGGENNALIAHNVSKTFSRYTVFGKKEKRVLHGVSLRVGERERVALLGKSGSGKSTLAKILSGLEGVDLRGGVYLNGKEIWHTSPRYDKKSAKSVQAKSAGTKSAQIKSVWIKGVRQKEAGTKAMHEKEAGTKSHSHALNLANLTHRREFYKQVQILFQDPIGSLNPRLTLRESLCVPLRYLLDLHDKQAQDERILPLLARLGLDEGLLDVYPAMLSGGQAARFCIARALLVRPRYIILDESTSGVDERVEGEILALLSELQEEEGLGVLLITHSVELARKFCEKIYIMESGKIIEEVRGQEAFRSAFGEEIDRLSGFA